MTGKLGTSFGAIGNALARRGSSGAVILGYHDIDSVDRTGWTVSPDALDHHLAMLRRLRFTIVPLRDLIDRFEAGRPVDRLAAITFDDALLGVLSNGLPVLAAHDAQATVFVVTDHLGVEPAWWPGAARTLDERELRSLVAAGHDLASHTASHRSLVGMSDVELLAELSASRERLCMLVGQTPDLLAYPSGHHDAVVRAAAHQAGYRAAVTFLNGRVTGNEDPFRLPRLTMGGHHSSARFAYHLLRPPTSGPDHQLDRVAG